MPEEKRFTTLSGLDSKVAAEIQKLLLHNAIVAAVKLYMRETGVDLKNAKLALDKEIDSLGI